MSDVSETLCGGAFHLTGRPVDIPFEISAGLFFYAITVGVESFGSE